MSTVNDSKLTWEEQAFVMLSHPQGLQFRVVVLDTNEAPQFLADQAGHDDVPALPAPVLATARPVVHGAAGDHEGRFAFEEAVEVTAE